MTYNIRQGQVVGKEQFTGAAMRALRVIASIVMAEVLQRCMKACARLMTSGPLGKGGRQPITVRAYQINLRYHVTPHASKVFGNIRTTTGTIQLFL